MRRLLNRYITREIGALFLLGIIIFTLILLMGRLIKLTDLVISRGVPLADIGRMIFYLMPSFLVFTIPMAFLLAVLLAFGRLSSDNEITVIKASGISLVQLMPPVLFCSLVATALTLAAGAFGVPWGNSAFKRLSLEAVKQNATVTIREKIFWDEIPGIVLYTEHYDEEHQLLKGVIIHDGREKQRPMTIFASEGIIASGGNQQDIRFILKQGSIHAAGTGQDYRLINFGEYAMTIGTNLGKTGIARNESDMTLAELRRTMSDLGIPIQASLKSAAEFHSRLALPFACLVFAVLAMPLGIQNRRAGKSAGFSLSIGILLAYYIMLSLLRTLAERGTLPPGLALWLPNLCFLALGWKLLWQASLERNLLPFFSLGRLQQLLRRGSR